MSKRSKSSRWVQTGISLFCRNVGCGGTSVDLLTDGETIKAIWSNENCPYTDFGVTVDSQGAASNEHNVSYLHRETISFIYNSIAQNSLRNKRRFIKGISCRSVGPGGTTVDFVTDGARVLCVWTNENCPYDHTEGETATEFEERSELYIASDLHNVNVLTLYDIERLASSVGIKLNTTTFPAIRG